MARAGIFKIRPIVACLLLLLLVPAAYAGVTAAPDPEAPYEIRLFAVDPGVIHSTEVTDATNGRNGEVIFATKYGLSSYNGSWVIKHMTRDNLSEGLMDDFVTGVEYDNRGNLWVGYPGGLQIYDGTTYLTIRDQQILKDPRILSIQRWGDTMWLSTGTSGIHRYLNGTWTWYQPMSENGPGFYEADSMALDPQADVLVVSTRDGGIWTVASPLDPVRFEQVEAAGSPPAVWHVRQDPLGGVYVFDTGTVRKYTPAGGFTGILAATDLSVKPTVINDCVAAPDGSLYIGTDDGIYIVRDGSIVRHLGRFEGIGSSNVVRKLFADAQNRVWFATQDNIGYYRETGTGSALAFELVNASAETAPSTEPTIITAPTVATTAAPLDPAQDPVQSKEPSLLERLNAFFSDLLSGIFPG